MQPGEADLSFLWDMYHAAKEIVEFTSGFNLNRFARQKIVRYAVERQIVVIGEASKKISDVFKRTHPEFPWKSIVAQRNILSHEYGEMLIEKVWIMASVQIPELILHLDPLIPSELKADSIE